MATAAAVSWQMTRLPFGLATFSTSRADPGVPQSFHAEAVCAIARMRAKARTRMSQTPHSLRRIVAIATTECSSGEVGSAGERISSTRDDGLRGTLPGR